MGHLSWTDQFLKAVVNCECDRFYGTVAAITQRFLKDEAARFQSSVTTK
jgi:TorA maturation chaperone TorD